MQSPIDRLRTMVDSEKIGKNAESLLEQITGASELAEALTQLADAVNEATCALDVYREAEGNEKAEMRDAALDALERVCNTAEFAVGEADMPNWLLLELTVKRIGSE